MTILAESGATKTDWRSIASDGTVYSMRSTGMNVATADVAFVEKTLREAIPKLNPSGETVERIHFYAAGMIPTPGNPVPEGAARLHGEFMKAFPEAEVAYASDLLAAARALFGRKPGIAVILGTGSNSCEYDGKQIVKNVRSGGFILGDEGGGASLGRQFVSDFLKGIVPEPVASEFAAKYDMEYFHVVKNVYRGPSPASYLGSFAPFIMEHYASCLYVKCLVDNNFRTLFERCLLQYDIEGKPVGVVGGFGFAHKEILLRVAQEYGVGISDIVSSPIEGLVKYHIEENEN